MVSFVEAVRRPTTGWRTTSFGFLSLSEPTIIGKLSLNIIQRVGLTESVSNTLRKRYIAHGSHHRRTGTAPTIYGYTVLGGPGVYPCKQKNGSIGLPRPTKYLETLF